MKVQVAYADALSEALVTLDVDEGCDVEAAVARSNLLARIDLPRETLASAFWVGRSYPSTLLAPGVRVDFTRPLRCDAKAARRERAAHGR
jgi:putative ubiquitin-RnfH superfamily antitoxin RatB of RatAB toxin-antitoxin module